MEELLDSSELDRRNLRRFGVELSGTLIAGCVTILSVPDLLQLTQPKSLPWYLVSLSPMLIIALTVWVGVRHDRRCDEYARGLQRRSIYFAFFGTGVVTFAYGLLELTGLPRLSMLNVWLVMTLMWCLGWCWTMAQERRKRSEHDG